MRSPLRRRGPYRSILLVIAVVVAWLLYAAILAVARRLLRGRRPYLLSILNATENPTRLGLLLLALAIALPTTPLGPETRTVLVRCLVLATICLLGWIATTALEIAATLYLLRFRLDIDDNLLARKHVTQVRVLVRVLDTVIVPDHRRLRADDVRRRASIRRQPVCLRRRCRHHRRPCGAAGAEQPLRRRTACGDAADPYRRRRHRGE